MKKPRRKPPARFTMAEIAEAWDSRSVIPVLWVYSNAARELVLGLNAIARRRAKKGKRK